jgi:PrcB C-terminal
MTTFTRFVLLALIGIGATVSSLAAGDTPWLEITSLPSLRYPASTMETFRVVRSLGEWNALWQPSVSNPSSMPRRESWPIDVDFTKYTLLLVALGTRPSGGFTVTIRDARDDGTVVHVSVLEVRPRGPDCAVTAALTYPTTAVLIPRTDKAVRFEIESADLDCRSFRSPVGG